MVCSEYVDSLVKITCYELIVVIGDIRNYICRDTVCPYKHEILVTAEIGCSEPKSAFVLIGISALFNQLYNSCRLTAFVK